MAHMYPESLEGVAVRSPAERSLYEVFKDQVSDHFTIVHSVSWLDRRREGDSLADGEADFIVIHPKMGLLVIEVKGGRIGFEASEGWFSIRRDGGRVSIKNPVQQVLRSKYALIRKIDSLPNWNRAMPTIGHAVAFPDGTVDLQDEDLGPNAPAEILFFYEDLNDPESWLRSCMKYWAGNDFVPPGEDGAEIIRRLLRKSWHMREPRLGEQIGPEETAIQKYTEQQFRNLELLSHQPRAAIRGCAGSGKTVLALEKSRRLADEGFRTLLTCYNRALAEELRAKAGQRPRLDIQNFHSLARRLAADTGFDQSSDWDETAPGFYDAIMPEALLKAAETGDDSYRYDAVVVDEAQDFEDLWWAGIEEILREPGKGVLYIFYDDNQRVYGRQSKIPLQDTPFPLYENCRNTQRIHEWVLRFYRSERRPEGKGPEGRPVQFDVWNGELNGLRALLTGILSRLVYEEDVETKDIVVLSPGGNDKSPLSDMEKPGAFELVDHPPRSDQEVESTSIRLFKGLERPVVILLMPEWGRGYEELFYVGASRARNHLIVVAGEEVAPRLEASRQEAEV